GSSVPTRSLIFSGPEKAVCTGTCWSSANPISSAIGSLASSASASSFPVKWSLDGTLRCYSARCGMRTASLSACSTTSIVSSSSSSRAGSSASVLTACSDLPIKASWSNVRRTCCITVQGRSRSSAGQYGRHHSCPSVGTATPGRPRGGTLVSMGRERHPEEAERTLENLVRLAVWPAVLALAAGTTALILRSDVTNSPGLTAGLTLLVGLSWSAIGLVQRLRRPANRLGSLMLLFGFVWFGGRGIYVNPPLLYTIGLFLGAGVFPVLGHVLLAFPSGRLEGRIPRLLVTAGYLDTLVIVGVGNLFYDGTPSDPRNLALVDANAALADALKNTSRGVGIALFSATLIILARRWLRATPRWRHAFGLVFWVGFAAVLSSTISILIRAPYRPLRWVDAISYGIVAAVPLALTIDLLRGTLGRGAVADLVVQLGDTRAPGHLRDALARALHDPTLSLA